MIVQQLKENPEADRIAMTKKFPLIVAIFVEPFGIYSDDAQPINVEVTRTRSKIRLINFILCRLYGLSP